MNIQGEEEAVKEGMQSRVNCVLMKEEKKITLKSWTPMTANMKFNRKVTSMMLPIVFTATITHWTTCCECVFVRVHFNFFGWFMVYWSTDNSRRRGKEGKERKKT